jgi:tetratricopeptide (TPR) repeat protein
MFHYTDKYTKEELNNLEQLLLSNDNSNVLLAIELIRNQGFHERLERPLALIFYLRPDFWDENTQKAVQKLYKSRIESVRRGELQNELMLIKSYHDYNFDELTETQIQTQINLLQLFYGSYLQNRPHFLPVFRWIGRALSRTDYIDLAQKVYLIAIHWGTQDEDTFFNLALLYQNELNDLQKAAIYYHEALKIDRLDYVAHNNLGQIYESLKQYEQAEKHLEEALTIRPTYIHSIINLAYIRWRHQPQYENAKSLYEQALQQDPYETYALCNYAALLIQHYEGEENLQKAEQMLNTSLEIDESDDYAWKQLGKLMLKKKSPTKGQSP